MPPKPTIDIDALTASMLGARASAPPAPMHTGRRGIAVMKMLVIGEDMRRDNKSDYHNVRVALIDMPGVNDTVVAISGVEIQQNGRVAMVPLMQMDAEDGAAKRAKREEAERKKREEGADSKVVVESVKRNRVGTLAIEAGMVFELKMYLKNFPKFLQTGTIYKVTVSEVLSSDYGVSISPASVEELEPLIKMPINAQRRIMAMLFQAPQFNCAIAQPVYTGNSVTSKELKNLRAGAFTPESRHMKNLTLMLPLVQHKETLVPIMRWVRGKPAVFISEPALSLLNDEQWPHMVKENGATVPRACVRFRIDLVQKALRDSARPAQPTTPEEQTAVFVSKEIGCNISLYELGISAAGVLDDRHWFNHGAMRYLMAATPMLVPVYANRGDHISQVMANSPSFQVDFANSAYNVTKTNAGAIAFPFEGAVNAGYPIDRESAVALIEWLASKDSMRYHKLSMAMVPQLYRTLTVLDTDKHVPLHWMQNANNGLVVNLLECYTGLPDMPDELWQIVIVPNMAPKCEVVRSLGWECINKLAEEHGIDGAGKILGQAFVQLARTGKITDAPAIVVSTFNPETPRNFDFLLLAVSRQAVAESGVSLLRSRNHSDILNAVAAEIYPTDMSDMDEAAAAAAAAAEAARDEAAAAAGRRDEHDELPPLKRVATEELSDTELADAAAIGDEPFD